MPSVASSAWYWRISEARGSRRIRAKSSRVRSCISTRIGNRPWSSGIRSEGLLRWNAPAAMNRTWSVLTGPYLVVTVVPSTIGSRSRWTPWRETSGPRADALVAGDLVELVEEDDARFLGRA